MQLARVFWLPMKDERVAEKRPFFVFNGMTGFSVAPHVDEFAAASS